MALQSIPATGTPLIRGATFSDQQRTRPARLMHSTVVRYHARCSWTACSALATSRKLPWLPQVYIATPVHPPPSAPQHAPAAGPGVRLAPGASPPRAAPGPAQPQRSDTGFGTATLPAAAANLPPSAQSSAAAGTVPLGPAGSAGLAGQGAPVVGDRSPRRMPAAQADGLQGAGEAPSPPGWLPASLETTPAGIAGSGRALQQREPGGPFTATADTEALHMAGGGSGGGPRSEVELLLGMPRALF
jgi:hypothetical protein